MNRINSMLIGTAVILGVGISYSLANTASTAKSSADTVSKPQSSQSFQFELAAEDKAQLIKGLSLIKVGDSIARVKEILGSPTTQEDLVGKSGEFIATILKYDIKRVRTNNVNTSDQVLSLSFDQSGHLIRIRNPFEEQSLTNTSTAVTDAATKTK